MREYSARKLAEMTGGKLVGPADVTVRSVAPLGAAGPDDVAFLRDARHTAQAAECGAAILVAPGEVPGYAGTTIVCEDAEMAMAAVLDAVAADLRSLPAGISPTAVLSPSATIGADVGIGPRAVVGEGAIIGDGVVLGPGVYVGPYCHVGRNTIIEAHACLHERVVVGADCVIHSGTVVGSRGFGFLQREGRHVPLAHPRTVRIGDRVELGALCTVDRGMLQDTVIEDGCKFDDHCHIAHNVHVGADTVMAAGCKIGGSASIGRGVMLAADCAVKDNITIGDGVQAGGCSAIAQDAEAGAVIWGLPARDIATQRRISAVLPKLPDVLRRLRRLEELADADDPPSV